MRFRPFSCKLAAPHRFVSCVSLKLCDIVHVIGRWDEAKRMFPFGQKQREKDVRLSKLEPIDFKRFAADISCNTLLYSRFATCFT